MSKSLKKMSRPRISFPNLKEVTTRPDQEVQLIESGRQKDLYGHKVANAEWKDREVPKGKFRVSSSSKVMSSKPEAVSAEAKMVSGTFNRTTLGRNWSTKQGPKSAALAGKLRSKFEEGDAEDNQKMQAHKQKVVDSANKYKQDYEKWYQDLKQLPQGSTEYYNHVANRPKYTKPRKPAKSLKATKDLSPEQMKLRGQTVEGTIEHEGFHHLIDQVERHYGKNAAIKIKQNLISHHNPETLSAIGNWIVDTRGYKADSPSFGEELLTHARDLLVNPKKRADFQKYIKDENKYKQHIKNLKQSHQKSYEWAQNVKPEDVNDAQLAASELAKAKVDEGKSVADKKTARDERASSWEKENRGMHSGQGSSPEVTRFLHNAKLHQIKTNPKPKLDKGTKLEHYSPKSGLSSIDPQYKKTGVDATVKGRDTAHPHSFFYRAGTLPEDRVKQSAVSKYTVEIPETAKLYDLAADPEGHVDAAIKANQGAVNMDLIHQALKDKGYEGFYNSAHPHLSNVVALYHAVPTKEESQV